MKLPELTDFDFKGKRVLVRADLDVPLKDGVVEDDTRIKESLPTIKYLLQNAQKVVLLGHIGRPEGKIVEELRMRPVALKLIELLGAEIKPVGAKLLKLEHINEKTEIYLLSENLGLLENLRFDLGEESNDWEFAKKLASLGDFYVNEAFATSHRSHASIVGIPKLLPHCAGLHFASEVENLSQIIENPAKPLVVIIGGAKAETKLPVIKGLFEKADIFLTGGVVANTLMIAEPNHPKILGQSVFDKTLIAEAKRILGLEKGERVDYPAVGPIWKIKIPPDVVVAAKTGEGYKDVETVYVARKSGEVFDQGKMIVDIGPESIDLYKRVIEQAKTIVFAGPMGIFEKEEFSLGTKGVLEAMASSKAFKMVGGGDTIAALTKFGLLDKMDYVSTGGGAMLEFLAKGTLCGVDALR